MTDDNDTSVSGGGISCDRKNGSAASTLDAPTNIAAIIEAVEKATGEPVPRFGRPLFDHQISEISARTKVGKFNQIMVVYAMVLDARNRGEEEALLYHLGDAVDRWMRKNSNAFAVAFEVLYSFPQPLANNRGRILKMAAMRRLDIDGLRTFIEHNGGLEACEKYCKSELNKTKREAGDDRVESQSSKSDAAMASEELSVTVTQSDADRNVQSTDIASGDAAETSQAKDAASVDQPKRNADASGAVPASGNHTLGVMERDDAGNYQGFRPLGPIEAIQYAMNLLWAANGLAQRGNSPQLRTIVEALSRLGGRAA